MLNLNSYAGGAHVGRGGERDTQETFSARFGFPAVRTRGGAIPKTTTLDSKSRLKKKKQSETPSGNPPLPGNPSEAASLLDVVAVYGAFHLGQLSLGTTDRCV